MVREKTRKEKAKEGKGREAKNDPSPYAHVGTMRDPWVFNGTWARRVNFITLFVAVVTHSSYLGLPTPSAAAQRSGFVQFPRARRVVPSVMPRFRNFADGMTARNWLAPDDYNYLRRWVGDRIDRWHRLKVLGSTITLLLRHGNPGNKKERESKG